MDRVVDFRRPDSSTGQNVSTRLSKNSRLFFTLNIIQVIGVGGIQTAMMLVGDFKAIDTGGMGPGRRVYMALFCFGVLYSCFLCLFAVRNENFLEIVAFVVQNFGYIVYSFVQVYHTNYKTYEGLRIKKDDILGILVIANCVVLITLNIIFTYLAYQLFIEYGWKIYKRVRFNVRLRAAFHYYELVVCLMKMTMLFVIMFAMCLNQTILREFPTSVNYIISIGVIPLTLFVCVFATYGIRKENKPIVSIFLVSMLVGIALQIYEIYSVRKRTCTYCGEMYSGRTVDIPDEVIMHVIYLASVAIIMMVLLSLATMKTISNFGIGLKGHFQGNHSNSNILSMGFPRELVRNLFHSSVSRTDSVPDYLPDDNARDDVIKNPTIVFSSPLATTTSTRKGSFARSSITSGSSIIDIDSNNSFDSIRRSKTLSSEDNNNGGLTVPTEYMKSNSLPDRIPHEQRPSVMGRISKQATNHLNNLYYRSVSIESQHSLCGCYFWRKRQSYDSYGVSINADDAAAVSSSILTRHCHRRDRADTNVSMAFRNENFNPMMEEESSSDVSSQTEGNRNFRRSTTKAHATENRGNHHRYRHKYWTTKTCSGVSNLASDVIVEEFEDPHEDDELSNLGDSLTHSLSSPRLSSMATTSNNNDDDVCNEKPPSKTLLHCERRASSVETVFDIGGESSSMSSSWRKSKRREGSTDSVKPLFGRNSSDSELMSSEFLELIDIVRSRHESEQQNDDIDNIGDIQDKIPIKTTTTNTELPTATQTIIPKRKSEQTKRRSSSSPSPVKRMRRRSKSFSSIEDLISL